MCSLHDLIVQPSVAQLPKNGPEERNLVVDQAAADRAALADLMFGRGVNWASNKRMTRLLDSTIQLGFPQTCMSILVASLLSRRAMRIY